MLASCDDLFEPAIENNLGIDHMYNNANYAEGILANGYTRIPIASYPFSEVATDDAVSNDVDNSYRKIAAGSWTSDNKYPWTVGQTASPASSISTCSLKDVTRFIGLTMSWLSQMFCDPREGRGLRPSCNVQLLSS